MRWSQRSQSYALKQIFILKFILQCWHFSSYSVNATLQTVLPCIEQDSCVMCFPLHFKMKTFSSHSNSHCFPSSEFNSHYPHLLDSLCCGILHFCPYVSHHSFPGYSQGILHLQKFHNSSYPVRERAGCSLPVLY